MARSIAIVTFVFVILFASAVKCKNRKISVENNRQQTTIPRPHLEALYPKGLRVSMPDIRGMELFAFHGKVNSPIGMSEAGNLAKDVFQPVNGQWIFEDHDVQLRVGDVVNYWVFVQINGMGRRLENLSTIIRELVPAQKTPSRETSNTASHSLTQQGLSLRNSADSRDCVHNQNNLRREAPTMSPQVSCGCSLQELRTISSQLNVTLAQLSSLNSAVVPLRSQVDSLRELLEELIKDRNVGTQLLLTGIEPPGRNPLEAIKQLIVEKLELLDLENKIENAHQSSNGILFEVQSHIDKKRILYRAEKRLQNSKYKIRDPQDNTGYVQSSTPAPTNVHFISAMMMRMSDDRSSKETTRQRVVNQSSRDSYEVPNDQSSSISRENSRQNSRTNGYESGQNDRTTRQPNRNRNNGRAKPQGSPAYQQSDARNQIDQDIQSLDNNRGFQPLQRQVSSEGSTRLQSQEDLRLVQERQSYSAEQNDYSRTTRKPPPARQRTDFEVQNYQSASFQRAPDNYHLRPLFL